MRWCCSMTPNAFRPFSRHQPSAIFESTVPRSHPFARTALSPLFGELARTADFGRPLRLQEVILAEAGAHLEAETLRPVDAPVHTRPLGVLIRQQVSSSFSGGAVAGRPFSPRMLSQSM